MHVNQVVISTYSTPAIVRNYINKKLKELHLKSYRPTSYIQIEGQVTFITYRFPTELPKVNYVTLIAKGIGDFIQREFVSQYVADILRNHDGFSLLGKNAIILLPYNMEEDKTHELVNAIKEEILEKDNFCIDGWIKFRLKEYKTHIRKKVDRIIFEYLAYQEYEEFIELLKEFIKTQESLIRILHVMPRCDGSIGLYDKRYQEITTICLEESATIGPIDDDYKEDMILSILLSMCPLEIKIHKEEVYENQRLIQTIQMVYEDKVSQCKNCKHCKFARDILTPKKQ